MRILLIQYTLYRPFNKRRLVIRWGNDGNLQRFFHNLCWHYEAADTVGQVTTYTFRPTVYYLPVTKIILTLYVIATVLALVLVKLGTQTGFPVSYGNHRVQLNLNLQSVAGIILYGFSFVMYIYLISKHDLGYIIPLVSAFVYILIFIASTIVFKEVYTVTKIIGIAFILLGLTLLNIKK